MASINPYLSFNDNCEEAFGFYKSVFGGEFGTIMRFGDAPPHGDDFSEHRKIMHMELPIGNGTTLMGSDTPGSFEAVKTGTNFHIALHVDSTEEADKLFAGLSAGGHIIVPMDKAFWGAYFGMLVYRYGVQWMVTFNGKQ